MKYTFKRSFWPFSNKVQAKEVRSLQSAEGLSDHLRHDIGQNRNFASRTPLDVDLWKIQL